MAYTSGMDHLITMRGLDGIGCLGAIDQMSDISCLGAMDQISDTGSLGNIG